MGLNIATDYSDNQTILLRKNWIGERNEKTQPTFFAIDFFCSCLSLFISFLFVWLWSLYRASRIFLEFKICEAKFVVDIVRERIFRCCWFRGSENIVVNLIQFWVSMCGFSLVASVFVLSILFVLMSIALAHKSKIVKSILFYFFFSALVWNVRKSGVSISFSLTHQMWKSIVTTDLVKFCSTMVFFSFCSLSRRSFPFFNILVELPTTVCLRTVGTTSPFQQNEHKIHFGRKLPSTTHR